LKGRGYIQTKGSDKLYIRKVLFTSKLALGLLLGYMVVKTALLPEYINDGLSPAVTVGINTVSAAKLASPLSVRQTSQPSLSLADYAEIIKRNPFNCSALTTGENKTETMDSSEYSVSKELGLALLGTISGDPAIARAVIRDIKTDVVDLYRTGQTVTGSCIEKIEKDKVILLHNGQRKVLLLNTAQSDSGNSNPLLPLSLRSDEMNGSTGADLYAEETDSQIQPKIKCVETILKNAIVEPYAVDEQVEGLLITGIENIKEAKDLGLKNGDIICTVNGHRLTSKQRAYQVFKKARSQPILNFELLRDNRARKFSIVLQ
jgi:type II secretion system protein C